VPVSDLAAVAQRAASLPRSGDGLVLAVNDARMREVYWCQFRVRELAESMGNEQVTAGGDVALPDSNQPWIAIGRGLRAAPELAERCRAAGAVVHSDLLPRASEILMLARPVVSTGQLLPADRALPVYVRDKVVAAAR
jgi:tRNA threonylcarbamoyladenosine biosynthesis protein TsaB